MSFQCAYARTEIVGGINSDKLVVIDSIMALFRVDFSGRGELADRQQKLGQMLSKLTKLSEEFNIAVYM